LDIAKGLASILVVSNHVLIGLERTGLLSKNGVWDGWVQLTTTVSVPTFFWVSGFFSGSREAGVPQRLRFLGSYLLYPYTVWLLVQAMVLMVVPGANSEPPTFPELPAMWLGGWMQFWYLNVLILLFLLDIIARWSGLSALTRLGIVLGMTVLATLRWTIGPWLQGVLFYSLFFELGVTAGRRPEVLELLRRNGAWLAVFGAVALVLLVRGGFGFRTPLGFIGSCFGIVCYLGLACVLAKSRPAGLLARGLGKIGMASLQIYCLHIIFGAGVRVVLLRLGVVHVPLHYLLGVSLATGFSLLAAHVDRRYLHFAFRLPVRTGGR
jgi:fucose 4-O-acetylase-like acetyltransferase